MCFSFFNFLTLYFTLHWMLTLNRIYSYYLKPQPFSRREFQATAQDIHWYTSSTMYYSLQVEDFPAWGSKKHGLLGGSSGGEKYEEQTTTTKNAQQAVDT